jgi:hypothetical protein
MNELTKLGSSRAMVPTGVFLQELREPSISKALAKTSKVAESSQETPPLSENIKIYSDWRISLMIYLRTGSLLEEKVERERLRCQVGQYTLVNDELFR